jgi:peptide/nickel transport system substrate-binding protein
MQANYWSRVLNGRVRRRRLLIATGASAGAAAFLAACGGDDDDSPSSSSTPSSSSGGSSSGGASSGSSSGSASSDLVKQPVDSTDKAVRGGTMKLYVAAEPQTLDPITPVAPLNYISGYVYGTLLNEKPGHLEPNKGELVGDLAQGWEISPDHLEISIKLKPGVKWHNKAPVNGRTVDIDDVLFSWKRYTELSPVSSLSYNGNNPDAPILSVEAADAQTLHIKLSEPLAYALSYFAAFGSHTGNVIMTPKEADGGFDPRGDMIGHGPFVLAEAVPSVGYTMRRHPDYYDPDAAFLDEIDLPIVAEYAQRLSQLKAGNIHRLIGEAALVQDLMVTKLDEPRLDIYQTDFAANGNIMVFGQLPEGKSPFLDQRVRQAISMGLDRDAWIDALYNVSSLESAGLPVESRWSSHLLANWNDPAYWLDPQGSDFGENAKYFQYNVKEAKSLLAAAGFPDGFDVTSSYSVERLNFSPTVEPLDGMLRDLGLNITVNTPDYATDYTPNYRDGHGQFEGWAYATVLGTLPQVLHPAASIVAEYWPKGGTAFRGFSASGKNDMSGDPELSAKIEKARLEFDDDALIDQLHDIQRYLAGTMWGLNVPGGATGFNLAWPAVQNHRVYRRTRQGGFSQWDPYKIWIDQTQPPFT